MNLLRCLSVLSCLGLLWGEPREQPAEAVEALLSGSGSGWSPADWESDVRSRVKSLILGMGRRPLMGMALRPPGQESDVKSPAEAMDVSMSGSRSRWRPADRESDVRSRAVKSMRLGLGRMLLRGMAWRPPVQESDVRNQEPYPAVTDPPDISTAPAGLHSLRYLFSFLSKSLTGVPEYSVVGFVDDVPFIAYTSESGMAESRAPWMVKITEKDPQFWEDYTHIFQEVEDTLSDKLRELMEQRNQTVGLHVFQAMEGCELQEDGSVKSLEQYAYDGQNFTPPADPVIVTQDTWDSEPSLECKKYLKTLLNGGEESLQRRVTPRTMVSQRKANERTFLIGFTYGFYPREVEVKWTHSGVEIPWESNELLPNSDGTYQVKTTVEVQEGDDVTTYKYHVIHSSLPKTVTVKYDPPGRSGKGRVLVLVASLMTAVLVAVVFFTTWCKAQRSKGAQTSGGGN